MRFITAYILFFVSLALSAQDVLNQAQDAYDMGRFEVSDSLLLENISSMNGDNQVTAYKLLALSSLNQDEPERAEMYVVRLLEADPYYTAYGENPRFTDMLERLKKGKTVVTTASRIEETTDEVPVPVTLITEDMIQASGARTLSELLQLYVPGMSAIGSIEDNLAMRGVYGLTQEHMLIMLNGHRLNSYSTNAEALDFRQNLDKVKQIEVLRGPASSLYGNVALTAVVNIITKTGAEQSGGQINARAGLYNSYGGSVVYGQGNLRSDIFAWGSVYSAQGRKQWENGTLRYIGGYNNKPSFDFGANMRWGNFKISAIGQHSKSVPYYNLIDIDNNYTYDDYHEQNGEKPGTSRTNIRIDLDYSLTLGNFSLSASAFAGTEHIQIYNVMGDSVEAVKAWVYLFLMTLENNTPHTRGLWQCVHWEDYTFGGAVNAAYKYRLSDKMYGSIVGGLQYDYFKLSTANVNLGHDYSVTWLSTNRIFDKGDEQTASAFLQLKHNFGKKLIFNSGVRFDHKRRNGGRIINTVSPRVSMIYIPNETFSMKGTYAHSFVDAPFLYRASQISVFKGTENMNPEKMDAFMIGASVNLKPVNMKCELNLFYNNVRDLVFYTSNDLKARSVFENAGKISMGGVEAVVQYRTPKTLLNLNFTYQYPFEVENFSSYPHDISNVPRMLLNLVASQRIFSGRAGSFWMRANMHAQSKMNCLNNDMFIEMPSGQNFVTVEQPAYAVFGAGVEWKFPFRLTASVDTYNLFNHRYKIGGRLQQGNPSQGFALMGRLKYEF